MQAVQYDRYGGPEVLETRRVPVPAPGPGEVLVRVHASGLNPKDAVVREGAFAAFSGRRFPMATGFDLAGEVEALGVGVEDLDLGERVWGYLEGFRGGAAAEYAAVPRAWLSRMPRRLSFAEAAALPLAGLTALQALRALGLRRGERLLVNGASGGVGSAAIQLAKAGGAHLTAVASAGSLPHCRALGADATVDYAATNLATLPGCFDAVLDCYGGQPYPRLARLLGRGGRIVTIAPNPGMLLAGLFARPLGLPRVQAVFAKSRREDLEELAVHAEAGLLRMPIEATFTLERVREAHAAVRARHARGKRVLLLTAAERSPGSRASLEGEMVAA